MNRAQLLNPLTWRLRPYDEARDGPRMPEATEAAKRLAATRLVREAGRGALGMTLRTHTARVVAWNQAASGNKGHGTVKVGPAPYHRAPQPKRPASELPSARVLAYINACTDPAGVSNDDIVQALRINCHKVGAICSLLWSKGRRIERTGKPKQYRFHPGAAHA